MEQHVIKRTLYVGLGGTGMSALLNTKKMFIDTYGEVPPMIGFLGLDTDSGAYKKSLMSKKAPEGKVFLEANEQLPITVENAMEIYEYEKENLGWLPEDNLKHLTSMTLGAGQVRTNGRFALTVNRDKVEKRVNAILNNISLAIHDESKKYKPASGDEIEIAIVFSVCGGTGCGTFINTAYLLREIAPKAKISGYAVLPNVFRAMLRGAGAARLAPNAFGAIRDLDYLMSMTGTSKSHDFQIKYLDETITVNKRPFDAVFFIDNKNANGAVYANMDKLSEMISLALVTASGALATDSASISDNVSKEISEGNFDVDNKVAWASGMGACEIKIDHDILEDIYSLKAAQYLINRMKSSTEDADARARMWIDSAKIRENEGNDQLIDRLMPDHVADGVLDVDPESPQVMVDAYISGQKVDTAKLDAHVESVYAETIGSFDSFINRCLASEGGLQLASNAIVNVLSQLDIFLGEMKEEHAQHAKEMTAFSAEYKTAIEDLNKYMGSFIKRKAKIQEYCDAISDPVKQYVTATKEYARKGAAITFFSKLKVYVGEWETVVDHLCADFDSLYKSLSKDVSRIENKTKEEQDNTSFKIDLTSKCINKLVLNKDQVRVDRFVASLKGGMTSLAKLNEQQIKEAVLAYTDKLGATQEFSEFTIDDVFNEFAEKEFTELIESAIRKSTPLFRHNYHGRKPVGKGVNGPNDIYFIGVPDKDNNRLKANNSRSIPFFESCLKGDPNVQFASIGLPDRVIIFRQVGVVPAYTIEGLKDFECEYTETVAPNKCKCYIDAILNSKMDQTEFSVWPTRAIDTQEDSQYELWVKACIFNLIRNDKGSYQIRCSKGSRIDGQWYKLGTYRNLAFDEFKKIYKDIREEVEEFISTEVSERGKQKIDELLGKVKENYMDDQYCHLYLDRRTLEGPAYRPVKEMIEKELAIVEDLVF